MTRLDPADLEAIAQRAADLVEQRRHDAMIAANRAALDKELHSLCGRCSIPLCRDGDVCERAFDTTNAPGSTAPAAEYEQHVAAAIAMCDRAAAKFDRDPPKRPLWERLRRSR